MDILNLLLQTPLGTLYVGAFLALGAVLCFLALSFYSLYRTRLLLIFASYIPVAYTILLFINQNPRILLDVNGDPVLLRILHGGTALLTFLLYRMVVELNGKNFVKNFFRPALIFITYTSILIRLFVVVFLTPELIQVASVFCAAFFVTLGICALASTTQTRFESMSKYSLAIISGVAIYPIVRSGLFPEGLLDELVLPVLISVKSIFSIIWFVALVEISRARYESEYQKRIRAFIELRDYMNTPIQVLTLGLDILADQGFNKTVQKMQKALGKLVELSQTLSKHESEIKWDNSHLSLEQKIVSKK